MDGGRAGRPCPWISFAAVAGQETSCKKKQAVFAGKRPEVNAFCGVLPAAWGCRRGKEGNRACARVQLDWDRADGLGASVAASGATHCRDSMTMPMTSSTITARTPARSFFQSPFFTIFLLPYDGFYRYHIRGVLHIRYIFNEPGIFLEKFFGSVSEAKTAKNSPRYVTNATPPNPASRCFHKPGRVSITGSKKDAAPACGASVLFALTYARRGADGSAASTPGGTGRNNRRPRLAVRG